MSKVIPIRKAGLVRRRDGLWQFRSDRFEDHAKAFVGVTKEMDSSSWAMAAIAASVETKYGESRVEEFAEKVGHSPRHVRRMSRVYREAENGRYRPNLTFNHHAEALVYSNPDEALDAAEENHLSVFALREWIKEKAVEKGVEPRERFSEQHQTDGERLVEILKAQIEEFPQFTEDLKECIDRVLARAQRTRAKDRETVIKLLEEWENGLTTIEIMEDSGLSHWDARQVLNDLMQKGIVKADRPELPGIHPNRCKRIFKLNG